MDSPRSTSTSRARRSYPNLQSLSLAPLSSPPLDASSPPSPIDADVNDLNNGARTPRTSYIAQKSAPTTPGILGLSRSSSRNGRRSAAAGARGFAYDAYFGPLEAPVRDAGEIPKSKSTGAMTTHGGADVRFDLSSLAQARHHARKSTAPLPLRKPDRRKADATGGVDGEWLHRAGVLIAGEAAESKGQSWLVRRASSTSLVEGSAMEDDLAEARHMALLSGERLDDSGEYSVFTPRVLSRQASRVQSRAQSRMQSRVGSARGSRRGSRVGSRVDLAMSMASAGGLRQGFELDQSLFDDRHVEPDFVDEEEDDDFERDHEQDEQDDEDEVARMARERGFGLGGWMDRFIGWTLFSVDEDGEGSSSESETDCEEANAAGRPENMTKEEVKLKREAEATRKKVGREAIIAAAAVRRSDAKNMEVDGAAVSEQSPQSGGEEGGWTDAAWLFSVASKVIL